MKMDKPDEMTTKARRNRGTLDVENLSDDMGRARFSKTLACPRSGVKQALLG